VNKPDAGRQAPSLEEQAGCYSLEPPIEKAVERPDASRLTAGVGEPKQAESDLPSLLKSGKRELYSLQGENPVEPGPGTTVEEDDQALEHSERDPR
jgi:hypothetical protein